MNSVASAKKNRTVKVNWNKIISSKAIKMISSAIYGFISALPIFPLEVSPFAVSAVAIVPTEFLAMTYLGGFFSYMIGSFYSSASSVSAMTAVMAFRFIFKNKGKALSDAYIAPLGVFLTLTVTGILCGDITTSSSLKTAGWIATSALAGGFAFVGKKAIERYGKPIFNLNAKELAITGSSLLIILLSLQSLELFNISIGSIFIYSFALILSLKLSKKEAVFASLYFGAISALSAQSIANLLILPISILAARLVNSLGKLPAIAAYIAIRFIGNLITLPIVELLPNMAEVLIESMIIILLPKSALSKANLLTIDTTAITSEQDEKIKRTADMFRYLSKSISTVSAEVSAELSPTPEKCISHIRDSLCSGCELSRFCCGVKRDEISEGIFNYANAVKYGATETCKLPRCAYPMDLKNKITTYMNTSNNIFSKSLEIKELSTLSYNIVSDVLNEIADADSKAIEYERDCDYSKREVDFAMSKYKNGKEVYSGDNCEYFFIGENLYIIISDGMGSGRLASIDSKMTCGLLKRFIISGLSFSNAIKLANIALQLKGGEESCTTADICKLNTNNGKLSLVKAGAAASYIVSESRVRKLHAGTLPIGILKDIKLDEIQVKLKRGDSLIMLSDGALNNGDEWIETHSLYGLDSQKLADKCVEIGLKRSESGCEDDITAVCVKLK